MTSIFEGVNPPKEGQNSNQNKGPHLDSRYCLQTFGPSRPFHSVPMQPEAFIEKIPRNDSRGVKLSTIIQGAFSPRISDT